MGRTDEVLFDVSKTMRKEYADSTIVRASEVAARNQPVISTGNYVLDTRLRGGLFAGRFHMFYGPESSGKTFSVLKTIATFQESCSRCFVPQILCQCKEGPRDPVIVLVLTEDWPAGGWAEAIGVNPEKLLLTEPTCAEEALDSIDIFLRTGKVDLVCLDSVAFLTPLAEIAGGMADRHVGVTARLMGQASRKVLSGIKKVSRDGEFPTVLMTNQTRFKVGVVFGDPETTPGGQAPKFAATTTTRFGTSKPHFNKELHATDFTECKFRVKKSKQCPPAEKGEFRIIFENGLTKKRGDIEDEHVMLADAIRLGFAEKDKRTWKVLDKEFTSKPKVQAELATNPEFKWQLRSALLTSILR